MIYAVEIMARNQEGQFQWSDQLVSILNAMGDSSVNEGSSVKEILAAIEKLDPDAKSTLFNIKVNFKDNFSEFVQKEKGVRKDSNRVFYMFTTLVVIGTLLLIWSSGNSDIEPETLKAFMDFGMAILNLIKDTPLE